MLAEIITIGDEILIGQIVDTNSAWMAEQLNRCGIKVHQITSVSDNRNHILQALAEASERVQWVLITGGLGPTKDDITKQTLCEYFNTSLIFSGIAYQGVEKQFALRGMPVTELNRQQAMVPAMCEVIPNPNGTASGMKFEKNGCTYISMPGVPFEMKAIMNESILPELQKSSLQVIIHRTILTEGIGESMLADRIEGWETALPPFIKLAYLPQPGMVRLRLTATGTQRDALETAIAKAEASLQPLAGSFIFGYDNDTLESVTGKILKQKGLTLSTAESCTGGTIAQMITSIPGSSAYFKGSVVAYANEIKQNLLGVTESCLSENGAVSEATVRAMVEGVCQLMNTDCAIAVSGIAGPDGGTPEKPVGLTWIAVKVKGNIATRQFRFGNHRERNIRRASLSALNMIRNNLLEYIE